MTTKLALLEVEFSQLDNDELELFRRVVSHLKTLELPELEFFG